MKGISVNGVIGREITTADFRRKFQEAAGESVRLLIGSPGGSVFVGKDLISIVREYPGHVEAVITSVAASMASALAVAADYLIVDEQSVFMMHRAWGGVTGNARDMEKQRQVLENLDHQIASLYSAKSGKPVEEIIEMMDAETWLYGREIVEKGFADEFRGDESMRADKAAVIADARSQFAACYQPPSVQEIAAIVAETAITPVMLAALSEEDREAARLAGVTLQEYLQYSQDIDRDAIDRERAITLGLTPDDVEAANIAGMTLEEFKLWNWDYSKGWD